MLYSDGDVDTPDRTVTPRRVLATQQPLNAVFNHQSLFGTQRRSTSCRVGYNRPRVRRDRVRPGRLRPDAGVALGHGHLAVDRRPRHDRRRAQRPARPRHQQRLDQRPVATTRARSRSATRSRSRAARTPSSSAASTATSQSQFQFLGSNEITYAGINEFIDNRPTQVAVSLESPVFTPEQYYLIGFAQDTWRVGNRLTLELGLRYDFYSVVKEKDEQAKPFFIEENAFGTDPDNFYNPDKNNFSPRLSAVYQLNDKTALRAGYGLFYGPGQFEDRIQPIENFIERRRVQSTDIPERRASPIRWIRRRYRNLLSVRGYTHERPDEYNIQYGASVSRELPGAINLTVGYTGSRGRDMFLRGVANTFDNDDARRGPCRRSARSTTRPRAASTAW